MDLNSVLSIGFWGVHVAMDVGVVVDSVQSGRYNLTLSPCPLTGLWLQASKLTVVDYKTRPSSERARHQFYSNGS